MFFMLEKFLFCFACENRFLRALCVQKKNTAVKLALQSLADINQITQGFPKGSWALCVYGSLSRGDFCEFSDFDLMLLVDNHYQQCLNEIVDQMATIPRASVAIYNVNSTIDYMQAPLTFRFLSTRHHLKYVNGDRSLYDVVKGQYSSLIAMLSCTDLVAIWHGDTYRPAKSHLSSNLGLDGLKRGAGGSIDYDFGLILQAWLECQKIKTSQKITRGFRVSQGFFTILCAIKCTILSNRMLSSTRLFFIWRFLFVRLAITHRKLLDLIAYDVAFKQRKT